MSLGYNLLYLNTIFPVELSRVPTSIPNLYGRIYYYYYYDVIL